VFVLTRVVDEPRQVLDHVALACVVGACRAVKRDMITTIEGQVSTAGCCLGRAL